MKMLQKIFEFKDFKEAIAFVNKVSEIAEQHNHHPDIFIQYNTVTITSRTHDAGGIVTEKDERLMSAVQAIIN